MITAAARNSSAARCSPPCGLATGVLVFGVAIGGIAALVFCFALGRIGRFGPRATAALIAGAALLTVYVVPFLKYPANPCGRRQP